MLADNFNCADHPSPLEAQRNRRSKEKKKKRFLQPVGKATLLVACCRASIGRALLCRQPTAMASERAHILKSMRPRLQSERGEWPAPDLTCCGMMPACRQC